MRRRSVLRLIVLCLAAAGIGAAAWAAVSGRSPPRDDPWSGIPPRRPGVDHAGFVTGPFADGPSVTRTCLRCHPESAREVMGTSHWTWASQKVKLPAGGEAMVGKKNLINNFCIAVAGNWPRCTSCHAGYGWTDASFDFAREENVDCLVCHDTTGTYFKDPAGAGAPLASVDLLAVARKVGAPSRRNCGICHFSGGGGDAVKHGDMDASMNHPTERIDVHMGRLDFRCQDCHRTTRHEIPGAAMSISTEKTARVRCTDCHSATPHDDERLNAHGRSVACATCHVPTMAVDAPTKMSWDWSLAGRNPEELRRDAPALWDAFLREWNPPESARRSEGFEAESLERFGKYLEENHLYLRAKGAFTFAKAVAPEYDWYNGRSTRYLTGQPVDPSRAVSIAEPLGDVRDPEAQIHPFKVHRGSQPYDRKERTLLVPKVHGPGGYWQEFDWQKALRLGMEAIGLPYSGEYGFAKTKMWWPLAHMVAPAERALTCSDCHGPGGRLDWKDLGYGADPAWQGTRLLLEVPPRCEDGER